MPERRPPPRSLNAAPRSKSPKSKTPRVPRKRRTPSGGDDTTLYWIAGGLAALLVLFGAIYYEAGPIRAWLAGEKKKPLAESHVPPPVTPETAHHVAPPAAPLPPKAAVPPPPAVAQHVETLKEKADEQTLLLEKETAPKPVPSSPTNAPPAVAQTAPAEPPVAQPVPLGTPKGAPARALPLNPDKLDTERIAAYQVALERIHFSCGFVDGDQGMRTQRMLRAYQASHGLPITGFLDKPTGDAIGEPGEPFLSYTVTSNDVASIMSKPTSWRAKAEAKRLGYNDIWEMLAEKFHCTRGYLKALNPGVTTPIAGTEVIGPKVYPAAPVPQAASLRINLGETSIEALDASGRIIAFFPCSIAKDKNKRPNGELTVKSVVPDPDYTFDPALFADAAKEEGITHKLLLPPGPRNPVGTTWIGLSLPGYGIHGTPEPENISRTQSHGCFRLANWNAQKVRRMVRVGTPVDVEP